MEILNKSEQLISWIDDQVQGVEFKRNEKNLLAAACLDLCHEHHKAIILLISNKLYGPAMALVRLSFETFVRGAWLNRCANQEDIKQYYKGYAPNFGEMITSLEEIDDFENKALSKAKKSLWKPLNDFTHGGVRHATRRVSETSIESSYDLDEIADAINMINWFSIFAAAEIAFLANNVCLANAVVEKSNEY